MPDSPQQPEKKKQRTWGVSSSARIERAEPQEEPTSPCKHLTTHILREINIFMQWARAPGRMKGRGRTATSRLRKEMVRLRFTPLLLLPAEYGGHPLAGHLKAIRPWGQKVPAKGKGKAASPVYVNDSSEEGSTYKPSEPGHEEGEGGGKERGEEEVCLSHNLVEVLIYTGNRHQQMQKRSRSSKGRRGRRSW